LSTASKKTFTKQHYDKDDNAKHQIIQWLEKMKFKAWVNPDQYGIDVLATKKMRKYEFEVEVKHNWKGDHFPFDTVHFAARKLKFAKPTKFNWFVMLNDERTHALFVSGKVLLDSPVVKKDTIYTKNERFVEIQADRCTIENLKD
jgi:hypothetical protein